MMWWRTPRLTVLSPFVDSYKVLSRYTKQSQDSVVKKITVEEV